MIELAGAALMLAAVAFVHVGRNARRDRLALLARRRALYVVHDAGEPHEGTQACRRCGLVIIEETGREVYEVGAEAPRMMFFAAGPVTVSRDGGWTYGGAMEGVDPCWPRR